MPTPRLSAEKRNLVLQLKAQGLNHSQISKKAGVAVGTVSNVLDSLCPTDRPFIESDKKLGEFNWREWSSWIKDGQALKRKASFSQDFATVKLGDGSRPVVLIPFSDQHIGAWGADYESLERMTDEILRTPDVYVGMLGDETEYAIKLRSVIEVTAQVITPEMQTEFLDSWFNEIYPKVAFASWDNHSVERAEAQSGDSCRKRILSKKVPYFNGIGHVDIQVGKETYRCSVSHRFKQGSSTLNPCASMMRYMRFEGVDRELCMQGDTHKPGLIKYKDGPLSRVCLNAGTLHLNSGYAKRYFSLFTAPDYPCVVLHPDKHLMTPYWSVQEAVDALGLKPGRRL